MLMAAMQSKAVYNGKGIDQACKRCQPRVNGQVYLALPRKTAQQPPGLHHIAKTGRLNDQECRHVLPLHLPWLSGASLAKTTDSPRPSPLSTSIGKVR